MLTLRKLLSRRTLWHQLVRIASLAAILFSQTSVARSQQAADSAWLQHTAEASWFDRAHEHASHLYHHFYDGFADHGITFQTHIANFFHGVASGGLENTMRYAGHKNSLINVDFGKLGVQEGLFLKVRLEQRWGESVSSDTGTLIPPAVLTDLPVRDETDIFITNVLFTQMLNERFGVFAGKLDTFDGDANAYAGGRGLHQFMNLGFVANPVTLRTIPYATLGAGFVFLGDDGIPALSLTVLNATDTASTTGFNELFNEGVALALEGRLPTQFLGLPGAHLFGATWNSRDFTELGQDPRIVLPGISVNEVDSSWSLYWNAHQSLYVNPHDPTKSWGFFSRLGVGDEDANPINWFASVGIGGNSPIHGRECDTFGVGYYYSASSDNVGPILETALGPIGDGQGVELFYNATVKPWLHVTPDLQVLMPAREEVDTSLFLGVRAVIQL